MKTFKYITNILMLYKMMALLCILLGVVTVSAQDFKSDISALNMIGGDTESFHAKINISVFQYVGNKKPMVEKQCEIKKKGDSFYYTIDQNRILINNNGTLVINDQNKSVVYSENTKKIELDKSFMIDMDSLINKYDSIRFDGMKEGIKKYIIYKTKSAIPVTELYINLSKKSIDRLVYHYDKKIYPSNNLVKISYSKWTTSPLFSENEFSEKKYLKKSKKTFVLTSALVGYELIINEPEL